MASHLVPGNPFFLHDWHESRTKWLAIWTVFVLHALQLYHVVEQVFVINLVYGMSAFDDNKDKEICLGEKNTPAESLVTAQRKAHTRAAWLMQTLRSYGAERRRVRGPAVVIEFKAVVRRTDRERTGSAAAAWSRSVQCVSSNASLQICVFLIKRSCLCGPSLSYRASSTRVLILIYLWP